MRKYWSRWNKCWETTFGFQTTQGSESWHWSIKAPLHGKVLRANELPEYLHDIFMKKESRRIQKVYSLDECAGPSKPDIKQLDQQFYNVFGGRQNKNISTIGLLFNDAGNQFFFCLLIVYYSVYNVYLCDTLYIYF